MNMLTAEQVRKVLLYHLPHREYYSVEQTDAWQAIADELNSLTERTCHIEYPYYGDALVTNGQPRCSECKTEFAVGTFPNYCQNCGAKVVSE